LLLLPPLGPPLLLPPLLLLDSLPPTPGLSFTQSLLRHERPALQVLFE
jgi:hypothetical protein